MLKYHNISKDDMLNGDGIRTVLWVSGCNHNCKDCQNPLTHDVNSGLLFTEAEMDEIRNELQKDYVSGLTFSGGDPLYPLNRESVTSIASKIKSEFSSKTIWMYTGYTWEQVNDEPVMQFVDVLVDGMFIPELKSVNYPWAGSTNQRVIDVQKSIKEGKVVLHESN